LAFEAGSNDFTVDSGMDTADVNAPEDSSSFRSAAGDLDEAWLEAFRHQQENWGRAEGTKARGNDRARYLDDSLAAIGVVPERRVAVD
jgi:hypothetical protein